MTFKTPLIWDEVRGASRQLADDDGLQLGGLNVDGPLAFFGEEPVTSQPVVNGNWGDSLEGILAALSQYGLVKDERLTGWSAGLQQVTDLGRLGGLEVGRLIVGSESGWMILDQPAMEPGVIQVLTAYAGSGVYEDDELLTRRLAYSPVLSYGATEPAATPPAGALWFDTAASRLKVWSGSSWLPVDPTGLQGLLSELINADAGRLVLTDGDGGMAVLPAPSSGGAGLVPMVDATGAMALVRLLSIGATAPWGNGNSAFAGAPTGGARPMGIEQALWFNPSVNAERLSLWDEATQQWKGVPLANPLLDGLASLRTTVQTGDLLWVQAAQVQRLPIGASNASLTVSGGQPVWHQRFTAGANAPVGALEGDLWLDGFDELWLRSGGAWRALQQVVRYAGPNGSGVTVAPGTAMVHDGSQWQKAGSGTARDAFVGVALAEAASGASAAIGLAGVVSLTAAQWSAVIDGAEPHPPGSGLIAGRSYFVSETTPGLLTSVAVAQRELPVGLALSSTHLLLRQAAPFSNRAARADLQTLAPTDPLPGTLWWDSDSEGLHVYIPGNGWEPVSSAEPGAGGGETAPAAITAVEAVDWLPDPLAAAIRFSLSDGSEEFIRLRGASGARVTMADNRTLVVETTGGVTPRPAEIDGGVFSL